jgi:hypothetical protein
VLVVSPTELSIVELDRETKRKVYLLRCVLYYLPNSPFFTSLSPSSSAGGLPPYFCWKIRLIVTSCVGERFYKDERKGKWCERAAEKECEKASHERFCILDGALCMTTSKTKQNKQTKQVTHVAQRTTSSRTSSLSCVPAPFIARRSMRASPSSDACV